MYYLNKFGEKLKILRKSNNLTQKEFAEKLNITKQAVSLYELGKREPSLKFVIDIANFFNCSLDELLSIEYPENLSKLNDINKLLEFNINAFSIDDLNLQLENKKLQLESFKIEIPKKIDEINSLIEFLKTLSIKEKNKTEFGEEISIEELYQDEFSYLKNKYEFKNIKDFFRAIDQVGDVSCGLPSYAFEDIENTYLLPKCYLYEKEKYFILKAKGDSMNKLFEEGEKILVRQSSGANNGDIVIAYIYENNEALCKKYFEEDDEVILVPCSTNEIHKVQEYNSNELCILGVVVSSLNEFLEDIDFEELEEDIKDELED